MSELLYLPYSPWSEKARWALDFRSVPYERRMYQPMIGELELRLRLKRLRGRVTVPVFFHEGKVIDDSYRIALLAEEIGSGPGLFPAGKEPRIQHYNELSERGLAAGRSLELPRNLQNREAMLEVVPKSMRGILGRYAVDIARFGLERTVRKYGADRASEGEHRRVLSDVLDTLRVDLAQGAGEPHTLLGQFSYADIAMAQVLAFVSPPKTGLRLGKHSRAAFTDPVLAERYGDLVAWRDQLYGKYRGEAR